MPNVNPTVSELLLLEIPILIEMLIEQQNKYSQWRKAAPVANIADSTEARRRIENLQLAIDIKRASLYSQAMLLPSISVRSHGGRPFKGNYN